MVGSAPGVQGAVRGPRPVVVTVSLLFLVGLKESLYFGYSCSRLGEKVLDSSRHCSMRVNKALDYQCTLGSASRRELGWPTTRSHFRAVKRWKQRAEPKCM